MQLFKTGEIHSGINTSSSFVNNKHRSSFLNIPVLGNIKNIETNQMLYKQD